MVSRRGAVDRFCSRLSQARKEHVLLDRLLSEFDDRGIEWAIVGGAARRWVLGGKGDPHDVDIVVRTDDRILQECVDSTILNMGRSVKVGCTGLGGMRIEGPVSISIDVWSLNSSEGLKNTPGNRNLDFDDLVNVIPLSLDAIMVSCRDEILERQFFSSIEEKVLYLGDSSACERPGFAEKMRSLCDRYDLTPSKSAREFLRRSGSAAADESALKRFSH